MYEDKFRNVEKYIAIAKEKDKDCKVFGACRHRYKCNPVASMEDVKAFEKKTGLKLPENYVYFLTHIGNGGAGPHYGMYSLEELGRFHNEQDPIREADRKAFLDEKMTLEMWKNTMDGLDEEDLTDDDWDETINMVMAGALNIGTQGCTVEGILSALKSTNLYSEELAEVLDELLVKFKEYPIIRREIEYIKS